MRRYHGKARNESLLWSGLVILVEVACVIALGLALAYAAVNSI